MAFINICKPSCFEIKPATTIRRVILLNKTEYGLKIILYPLDSNIIHATNTISLCANVKKTIHFPDKLESNQTLELIMVCYFLYICICV